MKLIIRKDVVVKGNGLELRVYQGWQNGVPIYHVYNTNNGADPSSGDVVRYSVPFSSRDAAMNFFELAFGSFITSETIDMTKIHGLVDISDMVQLFKDASRAEEMGNSFILEVVANDRSYFITGVANDYFADEIALISEHSANTDRPSRYNSRYHAECAANRIALAMSQGSPIELFGKDMFGAEHVAINLIQYFQRGETGRVVTSLIVNA